MIPFCRSDKCLASHHIARGIRTKDSVGLKIKRRDTFLASMKNTAGVALRKSCVGRAKNCRISHVPTS